MPRAYTFEDPEPPGDVIALYDETDDEGIPYLVRCAYGGWLWVGHPHYIPETQGHSWAWLRAGGHTGALLEVTR